MGYGFPKYDSVQDRILKAQKQLKKLQKKDPSIVPIIIEGSKIATSWWGQAWNKNLETYADYSNRISRGRSYVKNGLVLNLVIEEGYVHALVSGTKSTPYEVIVSIKPMSESKIDRLTKLCNNQISNLEELIEGKFPKSLKDMFNQSENGLFPTSKEIGFDCDCPDGAYMCKHVSAVLYAIGAKFDTDPTLFFKLRGIDFNILLAKSAEDKMNTMLSNTNKKSDKIIEDDDISELFNI